MKKLPSLKEQEDSLNSALSPSFSSGTRSTYFTHLSTTSFKSQKSLSLKPCLDAYHSLRVVPPRIVLDQYEPGKTYELSFSIKNCSRTAEYVTVTTTQTRFFQLARHVPMGEMLIAPGLEKIITVTFLAPDLLRSPFQQEGKGGGKDEDPTVKLYMDRIFVQSRSNRQSKILVPFEAFPCIPQLELVDRIDFGTLFQVNSENATPSEIVKMTTYSIHNSNEATDSVIGWVSKEILVQNTGARTSAFACHIPKNIPIRVTPSRFVLSGQKSVETTLDPSETTLKVEFLPLHPGKLETSILFSPEYDWPRLKSRSDGANDSASESLNKTLQISAFVLKHCARIYGVEHINISNAAISFGTVYFGDQVTANVTILNCSPTTFRWSLIPDTEITPRTPSDHRNNGGDSRWAHGNRLYSLTMTPMEGELLSGESGSIKISFQGKARKKVTGFKSHLAPEDEQDYEIKLLLSFFDINGGSISSARPIHITINAKCTPNMTHLSTNLLDFPSLTLGEQSQTTISIYNGSQKLDAAQIKQPFHRDVYYEFVGMTQFRLLPSYGKHFPAPGSFKEVKVMFCPRQLGTFEEHVQCLIKSSPARLGHGGTLPNEERAQVLCRIELVLKGVCEQSSRKVNADKEAEALPPLAGLDTCLVDYPVKSTLLEKSPLSRGVTTARSIVSSEDRPRTHREWNEKQNHKFRYISFIRSSRQQRLTTSRDRYFKVDGVRTDLSELPLLDVIDKENGLIPFEPIPELRRLRLTESSNSHRKAKTEASDSTPLKTAQSKRLSELFQKLYREDADLLKPATGHALTQHSPLEQLLDSTQLASIYAPSTDIDFGTLSVHSPRRILFNILNANSSKTIHVSFDKNMTLENALTIFPEYHIIPPMSVLAFSINLKQNRPQGINTTLVYRVNGRYRFSVRVTADIRQVAVELDSKNLLLELDLDNNPQLNSLLHRNWSIAGPVDEEDHGSRLSLLESPRSQIPFMEQSFLLSNPGTQSARFEIIGGFGDAVEFFEGNLEITPRSGMIAPKSQCEITARYTPGIKPSLEKNIKISVYESFEDGNFCHEPCQMLDMKVKGVISQATCVFLSSNNQQGSIDLGILPPQGFTGLREEINFSQHLYSTNLTQISKNAGPRVGIKGCRTLKIKNISSVSCMFITGLINPSTDIVISPQCGTISRDGGVLDVVVEAIPTEVGMFENVVLVHIIGSGKTLRVPIRFECREPEVTVESLPYDAQQGVIVGSAQNYRYMLRNSGSTLARAVIDLRSYQELSFGVVSVQESKPSKPLSSRQRKANEAVPLEIQLSQQHIRVIKSAHDFFNHSGHIESYIANAALYFVDTLPGQTLTFNLTHHATVPGTHTFAVPLRVVGLQQQPSDIEMTSVALNSPISLSHTEIKFPDKLIQRGSKSSGGSIQIKPSKHTLTIKNIIKDPIEWIASLVYEQRETSPFRFDCSSGWVKPSQSQELHIFFQPEYPASHTARIELHLSYGRFNGSIDIPVYANCLEPCLTFEPPELFLPICPVGHETTAIFSIVNHGCERNEVKYSCAFDLNEQDGMLEILFPEGKLLKGDGEKLTCMIRLVSGVHHHGKAVPETPFNFVTKLIFGEPGKRQFFLPVHGAAEMSQLSLLPFIWEHNDSYKYQISPSGRVVFEPIIKELPMDENHRRIKILNGTRPFRSPAGIPLDDSSHVTSYETFLTKSGSKVLSWLREHTGIYSIANHLFPAVLINNSSKIPLDLLQSLAGKKIPGIGAHLPFTTHPDERVKHIYRQHLDLLNHLSSVGACLTSVKAEFLLNIDDFRRHVNSKLASLKNDFGTTVHKNAAAYFSQIESHFATISKEAWTLVLIQMFRVYVLHPINMKHLKVTAGLPKDQACEALFTKTNVCDNSEQSLLAWATYHYQKSSEAKSVLRHFEGDLNDSVALIHLVLSHLPHLSSHVKLLTLNHSDQSQEKKLANAELLISLFRGIFGDDAFISNMKPSEIVSGNQLDFILILSFLYQTLPQFAVKGSLEFHGFLHEKVVRTIELVNPSNRTLVYTIEVNGSSEFSVPTTSVSVPPKSEATVDIEFTSRFSRLAQGNLIMKTKSMGFNISSFVFYSLRGSIEPPTPLRVFKIEAPLYCQPASVHHISVTNPFTEKATFTIQMRHKRRLAPLEEKALIKMEHLSPAPFKLDREEVSLNPSQTISLPVQFLPFDCGYHDCHIYFYDKHVGEFLYRVEAKATLPVSMESFSWTAKPGTGLTKFLHITPNNPLRDRALWTAVNGSSATKSTANNRTRSKVLSAGTIERESYQLPKRPLKYKVEYSSPFFQGPSEVIVKSAPLENKIFTIDQNQTEIPISFHPTIPGKYVCRVILNCLELSDIRVFTIEGLARSEGTHVELDFTVPAKETITQEIPILNRTDQDWTIKSNLLGSYFASPYSIVAKAKSTTNFPISFSPLKPGRFDASLILSNVQTNQTYTYQLKGNVLEPIAEAHILEMDSKSQVDQVEMRVVPTTQPASAS